MKIKIAKDRMIETILKDKEEYKKDYSEAISAYSKKLREYSDYIKKQIEKKSTSHVKSPPYPPSSRVKSFNESLNVLKAHIDDTIVMEDSEYKAMRSGIEEMKHTMKMNVSSLNALSY